MKKCLLLIMSVALFAACQKGEPVVSSMEDSLIVTGNCNADTRTAFGTPNSSEIPYKWSAGDYIWLGNNKSSAIAEECTLAQFEFRGTWLMISAGVGSALPSFLNISEMARDTLGRSKGILLRSR